VYEPPVKPDLVLETDKAPVEECVEKILELLGGKGVAVG
jgi:adenylylsulfate kinase-like enzyme